MPNCRILHVIDSLGQGGAEHQLLLNLAALDRERFENFVCYLRPVADLSDRLSRLDMHASCLGVRGRGQWLSSAYRLFRFIRAHGIALVHTSLFEADLLGGTAGRLAGVPVVTTLTNEPHTSRWLDGNPHLNRTKMVGVSWLRGMVLRTLPAHCIAVSNYVKKTTKETYRIPEDKMTVIHRAVPQEWMKPVPRDAAETLRAELHLGDAYPVLLNVGRLVPQKGQKHLIQAMPHVLREFPKARLLIVGAGWLQPELQRLTRSLGLEGQVHFTGARDDVKELLQLCDIFVFPSLWEGSGGNALIEAAALGRPCIASDTGPIPEVIENRHSGLLVEPCSSEALAQAICLLSGRPELARTLGRLARDTVMKKFIIRRTALR